MGLFLALAIIATAHGEGLWAVWGGSMSRLNDDGTDMEFTSSEGSLLPYEFQQIALGDHFSVGLKTDGTLHAWGYVPRDFRYDLNRVRSVVMAGSLGYAVLEDGTVAPLSGFGPLPELFNVEEMALNLRGGMARKSDGTLVVWGEAGTPPMIRNAAAIALRDNLAAVLRSDGSVLAWNFADGIVAPLPATFRNVTQIHPGAGGVYGLRSDGTVAGWGSTASQMPADLKGVISLATGDAFVLALKTDGTVVAWGVDQAGPAQVPSGLSQVTSIAASRFAAFAVQADGTVVCWPRSEPLSDILSQGVSRIVTQPDSGVLVSLGRPVPPVIVRQPFSQTAHAFQGVRFEVKATGFGLSYQWRYGQTPLRGATHRVYRVGELQVGGTPADFGTYSAVVMNPVGQTVASDPVRLRVTGTILPGTMVEWGPEGTPTRHPPEEVFGRVISMDTGATLSTALLSDGSVRGWMSRGGFLQQAVPGELRPDAIAAGIRHWFQLNPDGRVTVWDLWGRRLDTHQFSGITAISSAEEHVALLDVQGSVWWWNPYWSAHLATLYPVSGIRAVAAGEFGVAMLTADGTVLVGSPHGAPMAVPPAGLTNVVAIAGGVSHLVALRADGTVVAWNGEDTADVSVPSGLGSVVAIAAGDHHTLALRRDGTLVGWGRVRAFGANGWTPIWQPYSVPSGLREVSSIAAGGVWSSALLGGPAPPRIQLESIDGMTTAVWHQGAEPASLESAERLEDGRWTALPESPVSEGRWRRTAIPTPDHEHRFFRLETP